MATVTNYTASPEPGKIFQHVIEQVKGYYPEPFGNNQEPEKSNSKYEAFYNEVLTRCVADVAGMLQSRKQDIAENPRAMRFVGVNQQSSFSGSGLDRKPNLTEKEMATHQAELKAFADQHAVKYDSRAGAELQGIFKVLTGRFGGGKNVEESQNAAAETRARKLIIGNLPGFVKGLVQTPHPTELMSDAAIDAQERLVSALIKVPDLFNAPDPKNPPVISTEDRLKLRDALKNLSQTINIAVSDSLTIDEEMRRSVRFSQRQFDSVPGVADTIMRATNVKSSDLTLKELHKFGNLTSPETWSPGDQDSKPDMTAEKLQEGTNLSRRAMMFHYYRKLAVLGAKADKVEGVTDETRQDIRNMMHRLLKTACDAYDPPKEGETRNESTRELANKKMTNALETGNSNFSKSYEVYKDSPFFKTFDRNFDSENTNVKPYETADEFLTALANLRDKEGISAIREDKHDHINTIDGLLIQTMNFGDSALKVQIRQNAEVHAEVLDKILKLLPEEKIPANVKSIMADLHSHSEESSAAIAKLLDVFKDDTDFRALVMHTVQTRLAETKATLDTFPAKIEKYLNEKKIDPTEKNKHKRFQELVREELGDDNYKMYQAMESFGMAASNPDKIPRYLIAECRSTTDMLEAFFLLKVMESLRAPDKKEKVEIVNLVEHPDLVIDKGNGMATVRMTVEAMNNPQFRDHHLSITTSNHLLRSYREGDEDDHTLTIAEAKRMYNIPLDAKRADYEEHTPVAGVKMMMGAGSDITKQGSAAAASAMLDAIETTRAALLNNDCPILLLDYIGVGGGVHRSQPVSTSVETVQGTSMRQSPENIAQKILGQLTDFVHRKLALNPAPSRENDVMLGKYVDNEDRNLMSRVNLSNMVHFARNDAEWKENTRGRTYAMMDKYAKLYDSVEFADLMSHSANMFADLTKFAARPSERLGAAPKKKGYLAPVDVKETRAIGFGAALNSAGICAPLFFGGSDYLQDSPDGKSDAALKQMYLWDPKAQDTINRMTYGIIMADMDVAWKYLGRERAPEGEELKRLAAPPTPDEQRRLDERAEQMKEEKRTGKHAPEPDPKEVKAMAEKCLAQVNMEYNEVARKLLRLYQSIDGKRFEDISDGRQAAEKILKSLPAPLQEQLRLSRDNLKQPRDALADLHLRMGLDSEDVRHIDPKSVKKDSDIYKETIYPAMGAIFECFEHCPRAYTRPKWVKATEPQQQRAA